jgi:hypothetical protein
MVPEEEALIQEEVVPAEKALFDKKEEGQFDEAPMTQVIRSLAVIFNRIAE